MTCNSWTQTDDSTYVCVGCGRTMRVTPVGTTVLHEGDDPAGHMRQCADDTLAMADAPTDNAPEWWPWK